jgi:hypothetical protein
MSKLREKPESEQTYLVVDWSVDDMEHCSIKGEDVMWTTSPIKGKFYKIISAAAFPPLHFVNMYRVYKRLQRIQNFRKSHLVRSKLYFGLFSVAVKMSFEPDVVTQRPLTLKVTKRLSAQ